MKIDLVHQQAGYPLAVSFDLLRRAAALPFQVAIKTAGVWVPFSVTASMKLEATCYLEILIAIEHIPPIFFNSPPVDSDLPADPSFKSSPR